MSWFSRKKEFHEEATILGDDYEVEFDGIADAFNALFQAERASASADLTLSGADQTIPGTVETITVGRDSLLLVMATFAWGSAVSTATGKIWIGGIAQPEYVPQADNERCGSQTICRPVSPGAIEIKLTALGTGLGAKALKEATGYTYLLIPGP